MVQMPRQKWLKWLFGLYCLMMLWLLLLHRLGEPLEAGRYNIRPMETVQRYLWVLRHSANTAQRSYAVANLLGNVGLFVPLGIFLPLLFSKHRRFWCTFFISVFLILLVELVQFFTGLGALDVDDFILNLGGTILGWLLWRFVWKSSSV